MMISYLESLSYQEDFMASRFLFLGNHLKKRGMEDALERQNRARNSKWDSLN